MLSRRNPFIKWYLKMLTQNVARLAWIVSMVLLCGLPNRASADMMTYQYSGILTSADPASGFAQGTPFSGTFSFDPTERPTSTIGQGNSIVYNFGQTLGLAGGQPDGSGLTLQVGGTTVLNFKGGLQLGLQEYQTADQNGAYNTGPGTYLSVAEVLGDGQHPSNVSLAFNNITTAIYNSLEIPNQINLGDFPLSTLYVYGIVNNGTFSNIPELEGTITSLTPLATPEPATWIFLVVAGLGLCWRSRSRAVQVG
jgi:hypothetical protein